MRRYPLYKKLKNDRKWWGCGWVNNKAKNVILIFHFRTFMSFILFHLQLYFLKQLIITVCFFTCTTKWINQSSSLMILNKMFFSEKNITIIFHFFVIFLSLFCFSKKTIEVKLWVFCENFWLIVILNSWIRKVYFSCYTDLDHKKTNNKQKLIIEVIKETN